MIYLHRPPPTAVHHKRRPWAAQITGISRRYGLRRAFVTPLADYTHASRNMRGKLRGVVFTFPLHAGWVVEVEHMDARGRKLLRYFARVTPDGLERVEAEEVHAWALQQ